MSLDLGIGLEDALFRYLLGPSQEEVLGKRWDCSGQPRPCGPKVPLLWYQMVLGCAQTQSKFYRHMNELIQFNCL